MIKANVAERKRAEKALSRTKDCFDMLFDRAPVMMHSIDKDERIVRVNRSWLQTLGYETDEVIDRRSIDFLTRESRAVAVSDTLPLFWQVGSARSVGYEVVRKDGGILDVLLDAEAIPGPAESYLTLAVLRHGRDVKQWQLASAVIGGLQQLARLQWNLESVLLGTKTERLNTARTVVQQSAGRALEEVSAGDVLGTLIELVQDMSASVRGLLRVQEEWEAAAVEQQRELLLVLRSIEKTLAHLADTAAHGPRAN